MDFDAVRAISNLQDNLIKNPTEFQLQTLYEYLTVTKQYTLSLQEVGQFYTICQNHSNTVELEIASGKIVPDPNVVQDDAEDCFEEIKQAFPDNSCVQKECVNITADLLHWIEEEQRLGGYD